MLLILAGVVLNTVLGNDGIIAKAELAREKTNNAQREEQEKLSNLENELANYSSRTNNIESATYAETLLYDGTPIDSGTLTYLNNHTIDEFNEIRVIYETSDQSTFFEGTISTAAIKSMEKNQLFEFRHDTLEFFGLKFTSNSIEIILNRCGNVKFEIVQVYGIKY